jgi:hypothetical protein
MRATERPSRWLAAAFLGVVCLLADRPAEAQAFDDALQADSAAPVVPAIVAVTDDGPGDGASRNYDPAIT